MEGNVYDLTYYKIPFISLKDSTQQQIYVDVDFLVTDNTLLSDRTSDTWSRCGHLQALST